MRRCWAAVGLYDVLRILLPDASIMATGLPSVSSASDTSTRRMEEVSIPAQSPNDARSTGLRLVMRGRKLFSSGV